MDNDVLEVLQELEEFLTTYGDLEGGLDYSRLRDFIDNQRSIYSGSSGECAC